jgi:hypothetical protein
VGRARRRSSAMPIRCRGSVVDHGG